VAAALLMGLHRAFGIAAIGLILGLMMGYQINIDNNDEAFTQEKVEKIVRNAADNVKKTVNGISREINTAVEKKKAEEAAKAAAAPEAPAAEPVKAETVKAEPVKDMNAEILQEMDRQLNGPAVPTIQVPLRSESTDGSVEVTEDGNGYHTATIG
jgi:crotonobetainyl-CoA:carnitine CoA-transferase CaiB-like acyl-CoA transferase